jgi:hypothetical protein
MNNLTFVERPARRNPVLPRQEDRERASLPHLALDLDSTAVSLCNGVEAAEPDTASAKLIGGAQVGFLEHGG